MNDLYVNSPNRIDKYIDQYPELEPLRVNPVAHWLATKKPKDIDKVTSHINRLQKRAGDKRLVFVIYNIPNRDVGQWSKGGVNTEEQYLEFIDNIVTGIQDSNPIIIFEPDAIPHAYTQMNIRQRLKREKLIKKALKRLKTTQASLYLDIGNPGWLKPDELKSILPSYQSWIDGVAINTSNFYPLGNCYDYLDWINQRLPEPVKAVIDTSRNGSSKHDGKWCNPPGKKIGPRPSYITGHDLVDALLWIKVPGESDGRCNGGPKAGVFWLDYALKLCK